MRRTTAASSIQTVAEGSPAAENGLRPNDVILAVGRVRITNLEQLRAAVKDRECVRDHDSAREFDVGVSDWVSGGDSH